MRYRIQKRATAPVANAVATRPFANGGGGGGGDQQFALLMNALINDAAVFTQNATTLRTRAMQRLFDPRRDIDSECGYDKDLEINQYRYMYDREPIANRVVGFWPDECWSLHPAVEENEDPENTEFEQAWEDLQEDLNIYSMLHRADEQSGIGRFGVMLIGLNDGKELREPVEGMDELGRRAGRSSRAHEVIYLRVFSEDVVTVRKREEDFKNPRFGQPTVYQVDFAEIDTISGNVVVPGGIQKTTTKSSTEVHWTRIIHLADNREKSETYGTPRLQVVFNRMYDLRKIYGGSGEMFWKGGFPGYSAETHPDASDVTLDTTSLKNAFADHFNGLQRYIATQGMTIKSMSPQVADPAGHADVMLKAVAIALGVPMRKFVGSEQAQLASSQDERTWNKRVRGRQTEYITPLVLRPFIDRMIAYGALPEPAERYKIVWPDLNTVTDQEKAEVAVKRTEALAKYVAGNVDQLIPPAEYMRIVLEMKPDEIEQIMSAAEDRIREEEELMDDDPMDEPIEPPVEDPEEE